jgi:release factor glutamine methyltransferase
MALTPGSTEVADLVARLRAAGCVFAEDEAEILLDAAGGSADRLVELTESRLSGLPLEQVVGWAAFGDRRVRVVPGVFVPRWRTEFLVQEAVARAGQRPVAVDLCCGTGAVGLLLADRVPGLRLYASDLDPIAVACARDNLAALGDRATVFQGDLYAALPPTLRGRVDLLVVNAPYVPTDAIPLMPAEARQHEPAWALDGGPDGVSIHRRVAAEAPEWLAPGGFLLIETSEAQAELTAAAMTAAGLEPAISRSDEHDATVCVGLSARARARALDL